MKFEESIRISTDRLIVKECLKEKKEHMRRNCKEREYLRQNGYSQKGTVKA